MITPLAHLGHWYVGGPVFLSPVIAIWLLMKAADWRDRRRGVTRNESRVDVTRHDQGARIAITGALDWPALLDLENELDDLRGEAERIEIDLSATTEIAKRSAVRLAELVELAEVGATVTVVPGSRDNQEALRAGGAVVAGEPAHAALPGSHR